MTENSVVNDEDLIDEEKQLNDVQNDNFITEEGAFLGERGWRRQ